MACRGTLTQILFSMIICFVDGLKVLFIGTPGSGKSTVINILRGEDACPTGKTLTAKGITTKREGYRSALQESKLGKPFIFYLSYRYT